MIGHSSENALLHYLQALLETSSDAIVIIDLEERIQFWNSHAEQLYGIPSSKVIGNKIGDYFRKENLKVLDALFHQVSASGLYHQPRADRHVLISVSPIYDNNQRLIGALSIEQNISHIVKLNEKLELTTSELQKLRQEYQYKHQQDPFSNIKGGSAAIRKVKLLAKKVALTDATVLIQGKSGVGKELFAKGIHEASSRKGRPFVPINCGAIPGALFESELFGYDKGAFTGAYKSKVGKVESADNGTLFLDEVTTLPLDMQVKLLRVLQEREVYQVGGHISKKVNIRVIAATNDDIEEKVRKGLFRDDLYYRLNVIKLDIPPLSSRMEDIPVLTDTFIHKYAEKYGKAEPSLLPDAAELFHSYDWPGNVRELRNVVERVIIFHDQSTISAADLLPFFPDFDPAGKNQEQIEIARIKAVLSETYGNKSAAAKKLGMSRVSLYKKINKYGLSDYVSIIEKP